MLVPLYQNNLNSPCSILSLIQCILISDDSLRFSVQVELDNDVSVELFVLIGMACYTCSKASNMCLIVSVVVQL